MTQSFPALTNSLLTPSQALTGPLPGPLVAKFAAPELLQSAVPRPVQVAGVGLEPALPEDGDRVTVRFKVDLRSSHPGTVCRIVVVVCATFANPITSRSGNVISIRAVVTARAPQTTVRFRVGNGGGLDLEVPIGFAARPPQTQPDYDIVGVELSQGTQRDTASARPGPPERNAAYDGVVLAGMEKEWGSDPVRAHEVPPARIRVWVVAHGVRARSAPAPPLYVSLGRPTFSGGGTVVRYGQPSPLSQPTSVPVTPETGLSPELRSDTAVPYVFHWVPDLAVPKISVSIVGGPAQCDGCPTANDQLTILRPRVAASRMRPSNVVTVWESRSSAVVPREAPLLQASVPGRLRCLFGPGAGQSAQQCEDLTERLQDEAPSDGEPYRTNDAFFTGGTGPLAGLAPFALGATFKGNVTVPAGTDAFGIAYVSGLTLLTSGATPTRASVALTAGCVASGGGCGAGTALTLPLFGVGRWAVVRNGDRFRLSGLARSLHLAWGLAAASGRGGAAGAARWVPDEAGYLGGHGLQVLGQGVGRGFLPVTNTAPVGPGCVGADVRDLSGACQGLPTLTGLNGTWISPRRWDALLIGAAERAEVVNGNVATSGAVLPCPYRALNSQLYSGVVGRCPPALSNFDPRPPSSVNAGRTSAASAARVFAGTAPPARAADATAPSARASAAAAQPVPAIGVTLRTSGTRVTGLGVIPVQSTAAVLSAASAAAPGARVLFRSLDAAGQAIAQAGAAPALADLGSTAATPDAVASSVLPASSAMAAVEVAVDGVTVARLDRRGKPVAAFGAPAPGSTVPGTGDLFVSVTASDPDGDPLFARLEASVDSGKTWAPVAASADPARIRVTAASLPRTARGAGRLRATVSDAFDSAVTTSGPLTFAGEPVRVVLDRAARGTLRLRRGDDTSLAATVRGTPSGAGTVLWRSGSRRVASGPRIALGALPAGRHRLRATVADGRRTVASQVVDVVVSSRPPQVLRARLTGRRRGCASVRVQLATDVASVVKRAGRRVGRLPGAARTLGVRTLRVGAPCGARTLRLRLESPLGTRTVALRLR